MTSIPVSAVKWSAVSCCRSTIWGLFTIRTLMEFAPPPPPPAPQPAHPDAARARATASYATRQKFSLCATCRTSGVRSNERLATHLRAFISALPRVNRIWQNAPQVLV